MPHKPSVAQVRPSGSAEPAALVSVAEAAELTRSFGDLMNSAPIIAFVKDAEGRYLYANPYLLARLGERLGSDWFGKTDGDIWPPDVAAHMRTDDRLAMRDNAVRTFTQEVPFADAAHLLLMVKFPLRANSLLAGIGFDLTERDKAEGERFQLATAVEQVAESVMIADANGRITYVNPAFERITGYSRDEVVGENPSIISSGLHPPAFYQAMWAALTGGASWAADFVNRRKDGSLFNEEAVISPIRSSSGALAGYIAVKRDVTHERTLQERSARILRERALIADTIRDLRAGDTPEATAQAICRQVNSLSGMLAAQILIFELDGRAMSLGFAVGGQTDPPSHRLPQIRSRYLRKRAEQGPWVEPWVERPWHPHNAILAAFGAHLAAFAPIRYDRRLVGLLVIDADGALDESMVSDSVPALVEFADLAGALLGRDLAERTQVKRARNRILAIIDKHAFIPVFQPIIDVPHDSIVGYEALTRFSDGVDPDVRFAEAAALGIGAELEFATLTAALDAAQGLPKSAWLDLNVSPAVIEAGEPLLGMVRATSRRLVLEVTEHAAISDYAEFRAAVARLGPNVTLAVDDAGAGFASLRHILELSPAFVKLDRWLVAGLETDEARQAMIVGLHHFASATGCRLIAEGIETDAELDVLRALDIRLGQGFLLGRPAALDSVATTSDLWSSRRPHLPQQAPGRATSRRSSGQEHDEDHSARARLSS